MLVACRFVVHGRVQGVGFRLFAQDAAQQDGISGWVRNLDDGQVEVFAEGDREAVSRFERHLRQGPPAARVDRVSVDADVPTGRAGGFHVR